ncbi:hypothetical protein L7F22_040307 [Adiantum nelumboides]|nr:hypothetical protein [Adiantum nelumboides]
MKILIFISYHPEAETDITQLAGALRAKGLLCTANESEASTILLYISPAYIAPHSPTISAAGRFLTETNESKLTIAIFGRITVPQVRHQARAPGWDDAGILTKLVSNMGIEMKHRGLDVERVASIVKEQVLDYNNRRSVSSASSSSSRSPKFDIFLSHAGEDKSLARVLREVLGQRGYSCFLDEESLRPGNGMGKTGEKQLMEAVRTSRLALFVLSDRSIKKWWPLEEVRVFEEVRTPIVVVWYQFLREQAEQYVRNPPQDLLQFPGALEFLRTVLYDPRCKSIEYPGAAWNNPDLQKYAHHIKNNIESILHV